MLKFSWKRRLLVGIGIGVLSLLVVLPTILLTEGLGLPAIPTLIVLYLCVGAPLLLVDGVEVA